MSDLSGRTCVVTGANSGIGYETVRGLARMGARVVMVSRDAARGEAARAALARETGSDRLELEIADLSIQAQVRALADRLVARCARLDVLVNNAGTWSSSRQETADGIERTWATNQLAYFLLTDRLRHLLERSAPARIVVVASDLARGLDLEDVAFRRRPYDGVAAYAQSKQSNRMWTWALARRLEGTGVTANALHPGGVDTPLFAKGGGWKSWAGAAYGKLFGKTAADGASTVVHLASSAAVDGVSSRFWIDSREAPCRFRGEAQEEALYALCERMTATA
ncbi:MAG: SDR family NAD(P)-dependent oxidoreductase [Vicinamibacteria bacterium]